MTGGHYKAMGGKLLTPTSIFLIILSVIGFGLIGLRFLKGIGAVSNLSDGFPLGIWIAYDVATGTALACGGYAVAILVYILNHGRYHTLIRSAILTSFFGYALAGFSVTVDLGRYWNVYNLLIPANWQLNSALFEVAICVMTYTVVLFIEFLPVVLEHIHGSKWTRADKFIEWLYPKLDKVLIFFIVLGITLPTMHQSSLGSLFLIATSKLHANWHTGLLPLLFLINCIFLGYGIVIFESILSARAFGRPYEMRELSGLASIGSLLAIVWMVVRLGDLLYRGQLLAAFSGDHYSRIFLAEFALIALGAACLRNNRLRHSPRWLFMSAVLLLLGGGLYRFNVYLIGFNSDTNWTYFPSLAEFLITVGIVAFEVLAYLIIVKVLPVLPAHHHPTTKISHGAAEPAPLHKDSEREEWASA